MKLINDILYIEYADFIGAGWKEDSIKKANFRNGPHWMMIPDPLDKRKVLVQYETLRKKDRDRLNAHFGNPYDYMASEPIRNMVEADHKAEQFFREYRYDGGKILPSEHQFKYTTAAAWLNMMLKVLDQKKAVKKELSVRMEAFWGHVSKLISAGNIELPTSYRRLMTTIDAYKENSYASLIDWRFGNKLSAKVGKSETGFNEDQYQMQMALIRKVASKHQNFDAQQVSSFANMLFERKGWPTVSKATVYNIMRENEHLTAPGRRGHRDYNNRLAMQHKRRRPDYPLYYITLDGWTAELLFQEDGKYNNRLVIVVVLDAFNNYPLGYAIGDRENTDLIRQANRNAATHIYELFGNYYQPRQLQSDHYGIKSLMPFYQAMSHMYTPAAVGNAKSKVIEPYFKYLNKKYCQLFPNWSGFNITSKKGNQPNREFLNVIKKQFPDRAGVLEQLQWIMARERELKQQDFVASWNQCNEADKLVMSIQDRLMVYGKPHEYQNSITGAGLIMTIAGERITYDSFDPAFRALRFQKWQVVYDDFELDAVLAISEDSKHRFVLERKVSLPMDVYSMTPEDHAYSARINDFNKTRKAEVIQTYVDDNARVAALIGDAPLELSANQEADLKLMFTDSFGQQKEQLQDAKGLKKRQQITVKKLQQEAKKEEQSWIETQTQYYQSKTDFSLYND